MGSWSADEGRRLTVTISATDADVPANALTFSATGLPTGAIFDSATRTFSWTPSESQGPGTFPGVIFTVNDGQGGTASETIQITVTEVNQAPVLDANGNRSANEDQQMTFTNRATDAAVPANAFTFSATGLPTGAIFDSSTLSLRDALPISQGPGTFPGVIFTVNDGQGGTASETIQITVTEVNQAPVVNDQPFSVAENSANGTVVGTIVATDADIPVNTQTFAVTAGTGQAEFAADATTGQITVTNSSLPNIETTPSFTLNVTVTDNATPALSDTAVITINLTNVNEAPVLTAIGNKTVNEGQVLTFTATATDPDLPANSLTFSLPGTVPAGAAINQTTGVFTWTPTEAQGPGTYQVTVRVTDNGTPTRFDEETLTITVTEVNQAPVVGAHGNRSVNEGQLLTFTISATDADVPANALTFSSTGLPTGAVFDSATRTFSWTPSEAQGPGTFPGVIFKVP